MTETLTEEPLKKFANSVLKWAKKKAGTPEEPPQKLTPPKPAKGKKPIPWVDPQSGKKFYVSPSGKLYPWDPKKAATKAKTPQPYVDPETGQKFYISPSGKKYPWDPKKAAAPAPKKKKWVSAGGIVFPSMDDLDHVYIIKPSNNYGPWAFPKGRVDEGETMKQAAIREVWEETGIKAKILPGNAYVGKGEGSFSITHFFLMVQVGGHPRRTDETERVELVTWDEAVRTFKMAGNKRDPKIVKLAQRAVARYKKR